MSVDLSSLPKAPPKKTHHVQLEVTYTAHIFVVEGETDEEIAARALELFDSMETDHKYMRMEEESVKLKSIEENKPDGNTWKNRSLK